LYTSADILYNRVTMNRKEQVLSLFRAHAILRPRDLEKYGLWRGYLNILHGEGRVIRIDRGLYCLPDAEPTENRSLAEASKHIPNGIICLLSALQFHELTTQIAHGVWVAIDRKARLPKPSNLPLRIFRFSGKALAEGVEKHVIEGVRVKITGPAKTVADCFKYRNKIGLDVALEALRDCRRQGKCSMDELWRYAKICRVAKVIKPYLEATS